MNWDEIEGNLRRLAGQLKTQWNRLDDDRIGQLDGGTDRLAGLLQSAYGLSKDEADRQVSTWESTLGKQASRADAQATRAGDAASDWTRDMADALASRAERWADDAQHGAEDLADRTGRGPFKNALLLMTVGVLALMFFSRRP